MINYMNLKEGFRLGLDKVNGLDERQQFGIQIGQINENAKHLGDSE